MTPPFTVEQVAAMLGCSAKTVQAHARAGHLPGVKFGDDWVFPVGALQQRLDDIALQEAGKRREPAKPAAMVQQLRAGRRERTPPRLPVVGEGR